MVLNFIGDTHGLIKDFQHIISKINPNEPIIQVGDMGAGFCNIPKFSNNVSWIRGNHDDPKASREHPNYLGDWGYNEELDLFYVAGAWSIDWEWRQAMMRKGSKTCWWKDEELSYDELQQAIDLYVKIKPKVVVSHEAPITLVPQLLQKVDLVFDPNSPMDIGDRNLYHRPEKLECIKTRTSQALDHMLNDHVPDHWACGHYHIKKDIKYKNLNFHCCEELGLHRIEI